MKKIHLLSWGSLFLVGLLTLISLPSFGQGVILKEFKEPSSGHTGLGHGEKCGHTLLEIQQEKELGVFGTKDFFEDWITRKITEKNSKPQIMRVQAEKRVIPIVVHIIHNGTDIGVEANISDAQIFEQIRVLNERSQKEIRARVVRRGVVSASE